MSYLAKCKTNYEDLVQSVPPVDELVQRTIVIEKADRQHQAGLEYGFTLTTEHYDALKASYPGDPGLS
jgi:hypothetical protein